MKEPTRLRDEGEPDEAELLASAASDGPSRAAVDRTLATLGIGAALTGIASASGGASSAGASGGSGAVGSAAVGSGAVGSGAGASGAGASAAGASSTAGTSTAGVSSGSTVLALTVKWIGLAGLAGVVAWAAIGPDETPDAQRLRSHWGAAWGPLPHHPAEPADPPAEPAVTLGPAGAPLADGAEGSDASTPRPDDPAPTTASAAPSGSRGWSLTDEIAALDRARRALEGDPHRALAELASYRARFPGGALRPEADALRVEALARAGRSEEAKDAAKRYGRDHPDSPHAERVGAAAE